MKVGFIGLGIMGKPMSKNLVKAGHELVVFDFNEAAVKELADMGAVAAKSSADVAGQCDVIILWCQILLMYVQCALVKMVFLIQQSREQS